MTFIVQSDSVWMVGDHPPYRLSDGQVDVLLDTLEDIGAVRPFLELYEAQRVAMGELHIARVSPFGPRLAVDNGAQNVVRGMFLASVEQLGNGA